MHALIKFRQYLVGVNTQNVPRFSKTTFRKKLAFLSREGSLKDRFNKARYKSTLKDCIDG